MANGNPIGKLSSLLTKNLHRKLVIANYGCAKSSLSQNIHSNAVIKVISLLGLGVVSNDPRTSGNSNLNVLRHCFYKAMSVRANHYIFSVRKLKKP